MVTISDWMNKQINERTNGQMGKPKNIMSLPQMSCDKGIKTTALLQIKYYLSSCENSLKRQNDRYTFLKNTKLSNARTVLE